MDLLTKFINFIENAQGHNKQSVEIFADAILKYPRSANSYTIQPGEEKYRLDGMSLAELQQFFMVGFIIQTISKHPSRPAIFEGKLSNYGGTSSDYSKYGCSSSSQVNDFKVSNQKTSTSKLIEWFRTYGHELKSRFDMEVKRITSAKPGAWQQFRRNNFSPEEIYQKGIEELELDQNQCNIAKMGMKLIDKMVEESRNQTVSHIPTTGPMQVVYQSGHQPQKFFPFHQQYSITSQQPYSMTSQQQYSMTATEKEAIYNPLSARASLKFVTNNRPSNALPQFLNQLEKIKQAIPDIETFESFSPEQESSPIYESPEVIRQEEQLTSAKLRDEQELFEKQLATKKDDNKRTEVYMKGEKLRSDEKAELEFHEARNRQLKEHLENLRKIQEEIEEVHESKAV